MEDYTLCGTWETRLYVRHLEDYTLCRWKTTLHGRLHMEDSTRCKTHAVSTPGVCDSYMEWSLLFDGLNGVEDRWNTTLDVRHIESWLHVSLWVLKTHRVLTACVSVSLTWRLHRVDGVDGVEDIWKTPLHVRHIESSMSLRHIQSSMSLRHIQSSMSLAVDENAISPSKYTYKRTYIRVDIWSPQYTHTHTRT